VTNDFNPYAASTAPSAVAQEEVVSRQPSLAHAAILVVALVNLALAALDYNTEFAECGK